MGITERDMRLKSYSSSKIKKLLKINNAITDLKEFENLAMHSFLVARISSEENKKAFKEVSQYFSSTFNKLSYEENINYLTDFFGFSPQSLYPEMLSVINEDCICWGFKANGTNCMLTLFVRTKKPKFLFDITMDPNHSDLDVEHVLNYLLTEIKQLEAK